MSACLPVSIPDSLCLDSYNCSTGSNNCEAGRFISGKQRTCRKRWIEDSEKDERLWVAGEETYRRSGLSFLIAAKMFVEAYAIPWPISVKQNWISSLQSYMLELTTELYETDSVAIFFFPLRSRQKDFHFFFPLYRSSFHVSHHMTHQKGVTFISNCQMLFTTPTCVPHRQFSCHVKHSQLATGEGGGDERWREDKNTEMWEKMERKGESEREMVMS